MIGVWRSGGGLAAGRPEWAALVKAVVAGSVLAGMFSLVGLAGGRSWVFDLCSHFQAQYAGFQLLCVGVLVVLWRFRLALVPLVLMGVPLAQLAPYYRPVPEAASPGGQAIKVLTFNVLSSNPRHREVLEWVRAADPDVAFFPEITPEWLASLEPLAESMPHRVARPQEDNFGFAFFSKHPIVTREMIPSKLVPAPLLRVVLDVQGNYVLFLGLHPLPPMARVYAADRDLVLARAAELARTHQGPVVVAGDFNTTPWSAGMRPLAAAGLRDARLGWGFSATWRRNLPPFAVPIDQVWVNARMGVARILTGPALGSDHHAVTAELRF